MNCYVTHPTKKSKLPVDLDKDNTLFYPESRMTTEQCFKTSRPKDYHIVTDCPFLISLYSREEVFLWKNGNWENPNIQTYGTSYNLIIDVIFGYEYSIPQAVISKKGVTNCMGYSIK